MSYSELLRELRFPQLIIDAHEGKIAVPKYTLTAPFSPSYGFAPILVPLWSDGNLTGYIGAVTSWFGVDKGFVRYYSESQEAEEIALTVEQLMAWLAFDFRSNSAEVDEVGEFAQSVGLCPADQVDAYFAGCREPSDLRKLEVFKTNLPQFLIGGPRDPDPLWSRSKMTREAIVSLIERGDYRRAWHGINSPGLSLEDVAFLLKRIAPFSGDPRFKTLVECWMRSSAVT